MKLRFLAALAAAAALPLAAPAAAQQPRPDRAAAPRLVVAIAVDQLSSDLFEQYRPHFTGGLRRLSEGAVFVSGYQGHAATETCPGHSTILTGSRPARTGIVANNWFDLGLGREDKYVYCAEDPRVPGSSSRAYTVSPYHLRVPTLGDLMRDADPRSRVVAVAGKDRAAAMMGGHRPNERWWWGERDFVSHAGATAPASVAAVNAVIADALSRPRPPLPLPDPCRARAGEVPVEGGGRPVGVHRFQREAGDPRYFRGSPELDGAVLALGAALRQELGLGQGPASDLLILGLSATDYVGHAFGTQGPEMCMQLLALDDSLGDFFDLLDASGIDYMVVLTSDHGGLDIPERERGAGHGEAARVAPELHANAMGEALAARLGLQGRILYGDGAFGDMYVARDLAAADRARVLEAAVAAYRAHPQVEAVLTREQIAATPSPSGPPDRWSLVERARASFDPERSGDFLVLLRPRVTPIFDTSRGYVATHGSPWDYDRRVPILFWRAGMRGFEERGAVETADILPTLAPWLGLTLAPGSVDGRCLDLVAGPESACPAR